MPSAQCASPKSEANRKLGLVLPTKGSGKFGKPPPVPVICPGVDREYQARNPLTSHFFVISLLVPSGVDACQSGPLPVAARAAVAPRGGGRVGKEGAHFQIGLDGGMPFRFQRTDPRSAAMRRLQWVRERKPLNPLATVRARSALRASFRVSLTPAIWQLSSGRKRATAIGPQKSLPQRASGLTSASAL